MQTPAVETTRACSEPGGGRGELPVRVVAYRIEGGDKAGEDPDRISFVHAVRVMRRWIINPGALPPRGSAGRRN